MLTVKNALACAALSAGAAVALVAAAVPNAGAQYAYFSLCDASATAEVCVSDQQFDFRLLAVPQVGLGTLHVADAAGYVVAYRVPNSPVGVPCVVLTANATTTDKCADLGLVRDPESQPIYLFDRGVDEPTASFMPEPLAVIDVCHGNLNANVNGFGINDQPIIAVCAYASTNAPSVTLPTGF
jgi:hypothetical protein